MSAAARGWIALASLVLTAASGCGSSSGKKTTRPTGDAGAAGETSSAGAVGSDAGASPVGSAGQAGEPSSGEGGSAGVESDGGAAGMLPSPACMPSGQVSGLVTSNEAIYQACRGAVLRVPFEIEQAAPEFACCGSSSAEQSWTTLLNATSEDGLGEFVFAVPHDAPYGNQGLALDCASGAVTNVLSIEVNDGTTPIVDEITQTITTSGQMTVNGAHLSGVTQVWATKAGGGTWPCAIDSATTDSVLLCSFDGIPVSDTETEAYNLLVNSDECGFAADTYQFRVVLPTE